jgi:putative membrane protein
MMFWNTGWGAGGWLLMSLLMLAFWAAVIVGVIWVVRTTRGPTVLSPPNPESEKTARGILDERFARGEITEEEYTRRRELLTAQ